MAQVLNQFKYTDQNATIKNVDKGFRYECKVSNLADGVSLIPGDCVKLVNLAGSAVPVITKITALTDVVFGIVPYEAAKANVYANGDMVTIAADYTIINMSASAAIAGGAKVMPVIATQQVVTAATAGNSIIGTALTPAGATGDFVLVRLEAAKVVA